MKAVNKRLILGSVPFFVLFVFLYSVYLLRPLHETEIVALKAVKGIVEIPAGSANSVFKLSGEFYFTPNQFYSLRNTEKETYGQIPGTFKDTVLNSRFGYGSYGLHISGLEPTGIYALHVGHALSSSAVIIHGRDITRQGQPGINKETEIPGIKSSKAAFRPKPDGTVDIIINISNFRNRKAGFSSSLILGEVNSVGDMFRSDLIFHAGLFAVIFTVAVFFFLLSFFYKQASFVLWFSFASIALAIRGVVFYPHIAPIIFTEMPWRLNFMLRYVTVPLPVIFFTIFLKRALNICWKIPYTVILSVSCIYAVSTLVLPPEISSGILIYYQVFAFLCIIYALIVPAAGLIKKRELAGWIFTALAVLILFSIYDLLVSLGFLPDSFFIHIGSMLSIVILSVMVLNEYANSIKKIQDLNAEMQLINKSLIRFVPDQIVGLLQKESITEVSLGDNVELKMPILSIDIRSFTHTSEKLSPNEVFDLLNEYFALVAPIVRKYNGIITKYLGDGFFALFPDGADSALLCSIEIQKSIMENRIAPPNSPPLKVGIGIDFGDILLGTIGNIHRMDSIIISKSYHIAEILQESTKKYTSSIIISDRIFAALSEQGSHYIRPIQRIKTALNEENFLFEVYDCDDVSVRELKHRSKGYIEHGVQAIFNRELSKAGKYFDKALDIFPDDCVAGYYKKLLESVNA
ncbi:adenylate/guanylate cyclase domain-containing protein [Treponema pedis]|uniref:adenylate/guanylate cyclase domain-containing protein n=1 Tax=Treponema pedis TaxID=409322 RepID=UPI000413D7F5|nr:adenylate/guanylate cyclase domain-containing protein [Treponema pedis]